MRPGAECNSDKFRCNKDGASAQGSKPEGLAIGGSRTRCQPGKNERVWWRDSENFQTVVNCQESNKK